MDSDVCRRFIGEHGGFGERGDSCEFVEAENKIKLKINLS